MSYLLRVMRVKRPHRNALYTQYTYLGSDHLGTSFQADLCYKYLCFQHFRDFGILTRNSNPKIKKGFGFWIMGHSVHIIYFYRFMKYTFKTSRTVESIFSCFRTNKSKLTVIQEINFRNSGAKVGSHQRTRNALGILEDLPIFLFFPL